jgi:tripartite-type tricarboxylate transporter receptor subunit TctC
VPTRPMLSTAALSTALAIFLSGALVAQDSPTYPARAGQVIVPFSAGGNTDVMARPFVEALTRSVGGSFVIVNREGGGGTIGFAQLAAAKPDGYTLGFGPTSPMTNAPHLMRRLPYGFDDFEYICQVFENIFTIAVGPQSKINSLQQLVDLARAKPGALTFGSAGVASLPHLTGEGFARKAGIEVTHVPFRGDGQVIPNLLGGQIDFSVTGMGSATESLRVLAVFSGQRHPSLPSVPTATELGLPSMPPGYQGLYAPKGTARPILSLLGRACSEAVQSAAYRDFAKRINQTLAYLDGPSFLERAREDFKFKGKLIADLNLSQQ